MSTLTGSYADPTGAILEEPDDCVDCDSLWTEYFAPPASASRFRIRSGLMSSCGGEERRGQRAASSGR